MLSICKWLVKFNSGSVYGRLLLETLRRQSCAAQHHLLKNQVTYSIRYKEAFRGQIFIYLQQPCITIIKKKICHHLVNTVCVSLNVCIFTVPSFWMCTAYLSLQGIVWFSGLPDCTCSTYQSTACKSPTWSWYMIGSDTRACHWEIKFNAI